MINQISALGAWCILLVVRLGRGALFLLTILPGLIYLFRRPRLLVHQLHSIGVMTLLIIVVAALFVGMVLGLQGYNTLVDFGAESSLGLVVALFLVRELGPVLSALLFAGRAGSALTAEIGLMKSTEQLAAMEMMAVNPVYRVVAPRFFAGAISLPLLAAMFSAVGVLGGYLVGVVLLGVDSGVYWSSMQGGVDFRSDVLNGIFEEYRIWHCGYLGRRVRGL